MRLFWVQRYLYSYKKHQNFEKEGKVWGNRRSKSELIQQFPSSPDRIDVTEVSIEQRFTLLKEGGVHKIRKDLK